MLHPDQMMSNTASLYSMNTDVTGVTGEFQLLLIKAERSILKFLYLAYEN